MSEKLKNFTQSLPGQHSELLVTCGSAVAQSVPAPLSPLQRTTVDWISVDMYGGKLLCPTVSNFWPLYILPQKSEHIQKKLC